MLSSLSFLLPSMVKWNFFHVFLILCFRNEGEHTFLFGHSLSLRWNYSLWSRGYSLQFWSGFILGHCLNCLICLSLALSKPPTPSKNRMIVLYLTLILLSYLPVFENYHCLWLIQAKDRNMECADFSSLHFMLEKSEVQRRVSKEKSKI